MDAVWRFWRNAFGGSVIVLAILGGFVWTAADERSDRRVVYNALLPDVLAVAQQRDHGQLQHPQAARAFVASLRRLLPGERTDAVADAQVLGALARLTHGTSGAFMRRFYALPSSDERLLLHVSGLSRSTLAAELGFLRIQQWDTHGLDALLTTHGDLLARALQRSAEPVVPPPQRFPLISPAAFLVFWTAISLLFLFVDWRARTHDRELLDEMARVRGERTEHVLVPSLFSARHARNPAMYITALAVLPGVVLVLLVRVLRRINLHRATTPTAQTA